MKLTKKQLKKIIAEMFVYGPGEPGGPESPDDVYDPQGKKIYQEVQTMIDQNEFLKGNVLNYMDGDLLVTADYIIYAPPALLQKIANRHSNPNIPGSTMFKGFQDSESLLKVINAAVNYHSPTSDPMSNLEKFLPPSDSGVQFVKWEGVRSPMGPIGRFGIGKTFPDVVANMQDYQMPTGEIVKVSPENRIFTELLTIITFHLGEIREPAGHHKRYPTRVLSLVDLYPGSDEIRGTKIPLDKNDYAASGFYFLLPPDSPIVGQQKQLK